MVNYACGVNQLEMWKYFECIIIKFTGHSKHFSLLRKPVALPEKPLMNFLQLYFVHAAVSWVFCDCFTSSCD